MQRPADVVVVVAVVAVGEPAVAAGEGVVPGEVVGDVGCRPGTADRAQEGLHHDAEPHPVVLRVGGVAHDGREVLDHALLGRRVEPVPDPGPGHVEDERDRGGLDLGLGMLVEPHPALFGRRVDAGRDPAAVVVDQPVHALAARARDAEAGQQEGAGEALQAVHGRAVAAGSTGRRDAREARGRPCRRAAQHPIGEGDQCLPRSAPQRATMRSRRRGGHRVSFEQRSAPGKG